MEANNGASWKSVTIGLVIAGLVIVGVLLFIRYKDTSPLQNPLLQGFKDAPGFKNAEGFRATNVGGLLACGDVSKDAELLMSKFVARDVQGSKDGAKDVENLRSLLSKLTCFQRDLQSPGQLIAATREVQFNTYSDIQNLADTTAQCFAQQIPERDLDIQLEKWASYGRDLLMRLCTACDMQENEVEEVETLFMGVLQQTRGVAHSRCLKNVATPMLSPRDPAPVLPQEVKDLRDYAEATDL